MFITYNEILLSGGINNIIINNSYITLGLTCTKYSPNESSNIVYASLRVYKDLYDSNKGLFLLGKIVYLKGYLNSYSDKNKTIYNYVTVTKIENYDFINANGPVIGVDYDGVETWNGKRCESVPLTDEKLAELEELLKPYKDGDSSE